MGDKVRGVKRRSNLFNLATEILESISDGFFALDRNWCFVYVNKRMASTMGFQPHDLIGQSVWEKFPKIIDTDFEKYFRQAMQENQTQEFEAQGVHTHDYYDIRVYPSKEGISIYWQNITNRKKAEEKLARARDELEVKVRERTRELKESEEKYRLLVENASEAVIVFQDNRQKFFNHKAMELSGYSSEELSSKPIAEFIHPADREMVMERYWKHLQKEEAPSSYEFRMIHKNGSLMWVELNSVLITWEGNPAILGLMTDITERKNLEQALKNYAQRITQVQEEERKRIAYELHDDTAQYLAILKLQLDSLLYSGKIQDPEVLEKLKYLERDAGRAVDDVRRYSHELRPGVLEHLGLQAALEQIAEDINKLRQMSVKVDVEGREPEMSEVVKLGFFRIAQEAINNSRKHAKASQVVVGLNYSENQIQMIVSDNGVGFDVRKEKDKSGTGLRGSLGLTSMQERAKLIGADLKIDSRPGEGTKVVVQLNYE